MDEFGKALEAIRDGGDADPYVLQQLAEAGQGAGLPIFLLTLQHLAFEETLTGVDAARRREWAKVQGRFENLSFVEAPEATRAMIGSVFACHDEPLRQRIHAGARRGAQQLAALGVGAEDAADPKTLAGCYPLAPLAALVLPDLTSRYGQHERTLFSFLAGQDPSGAAQFLRRTELPAPDAPLPALGLDTVYDYFVGGGAASARVLSQSSRWTEIATRLRDAHGLTDRQVRLAKSVALLNLISTGGTLRASPEILRLAEPEGSADLDALEARGVVTWRNFAGEYRIWQGAETDIRQLLETCRARLAPRSLAELLEDAAPPPPAVAARHSAERALLRVFAHRFGGSGAPPPRPAALSPHDGEVLLFVGPPALAPETATPATGKPVLLALPASLEALDLAAREAAAVRMALADPGVAADPVARSEFHERLGHAAATFERAIAETFRGDACRWYLLGPTGRRELAGGRGSAALSEAADIAYPRTPVIRNEMLHRTELTSQGAKARRLLLDAMIEHGATKNLGLAGYGPEMAMYEAALRTPGLHRRAAAGGGWAFGPPKRRDPLRAAWDHVTGRVFNEARFERVNLRDVTASLLSPPVGMKAGAVPVLLAAALLAHRDEIAIYEHGTFKPGLASDLCERLVKNPAHFEIKRFAAGGGARREVVEALAEALELGAGPRGEVGSVVSVVRRLVSGARRWDAFTRRTRRLGKPALALRDALLAAVEPDVFLFEALPAALGFPAANADAEVFPDAGRFARTVARALAELERRRESLLSEILALLLAECGEGSRLAIAGQAAALGDAILHPEVRAFVLTLANDAADSDADWVNAVATVVAKKAPSEWVDADLDRFRGELRHRVAAFRRLVALHADTRIRAPGERPFRALRFIFTRPDGAEHIGLAGIEETVRDEADRALDAALASLAEIAGSRRRGTDALLAVLGERLLGAESATAERTENPFRDRRAAGA